MYFSYLYSSWVLKNIFTDSEDQGNKFWSAETGTLRLQAYQKTRHIKKQYNEWEFCPQSYDLKVSFNSSEWVYKKEDGTKSEKSRDGSKYWNFGHDLDFKFSGARSVFLDQSCPCIYSSNSVLESIWPWFLLMRVHMHCPFELLKILSLIYPVWWCRNASPEML